MHPPFIIYALPRSRTYWLSQALSYGGWHCGHEQARYVRSMADVVSWFAQPMTGTVETAAAPYWRLIQSIRPDLRVVVVRRPVAEVVDSVVRIFPHLNPLALGKEMRHLDRKLDQIEHRVPGVLSVRFADLSNEDVFASVWRHCLPFNFPRAWFEQFAPRNLQCNLPAMARYSEANRTQLRDAVTLLKQRSLAQLWRASKDPVQQDGITFQEETYDAICRDGQHLFEEHCIAVGEPPDQWRRKNHEVIKRIEKNQAWQIMTARGHNGLMYGYLCTVLAPSLEKVGVNMAVQTLFYGSPDVRGLGMRLQRASIANLRARGGNWEVMQRAGVRGDGPRMGAIYRRMGAEDEGRLYRLKLEAA